MQIKRRILVVDDELNICSTIKEILEEESFDVDIAYSGSEAREKFYSNPHDLVLLDVWMPDVDGITLLRELSAKQVDTIFIMMSGHATVDTAIQATKLGAKAFLEKPITLQLLLDTVNYHLEFDGEREKLTDGMMELPVSLIGTEPTTLEFRTNLLRKLSFNQACIITGSIYFEWNAFKKYLIKKLAPLHYYEVSEYALDSTLEKVIYLLTKVQEKVSSQVLILELSLSTFESDPLEVDKLITLAKESYEKVFIIIKYSKDDEANKIQFCAEQSICSLTMLRIPLLKEQCKDIPEKITYYLNARATELELSMKSMSPEQISTLINHPWEKDYFELKLALEHYLITGTLDLDQAIKSDILNALIALDQRMLTIKFKDAREQFEYVYLFKQLNDFNGKISKMAKHIGVERTYLYRKLKSLNINYS
jgi:two-component system, NtrC family, nitrogen regulation response regulator NtrX